MNSLIISKETYNMLKETVSKDYTRFFMAKPYIDMEKKKIIATDGRRIAIIDLTDSYIAAMSTGEITTGHYDLVKVDSKTFKLIPAGDCRQFPNWERVIPDYDNLKSIVDDSGLYLQGNMEKDSHKICTLIITIKQPINLDYLKAIKQINIFKVKKDLEKEMSPLEFSFQGGVYILMPMANKRD